MFNPTEMSDNEKYHKATRPWYDDDGKLHLPHGWTEKKPSYWKKFNTKTFWFMLGIVCGFALFPLILWMII